MSRRAQWQERRFAERERARAKCERCETPLGYARFCLVHSGRGYLVLCRSCCGKHLAPAAVARRLARLHRRGGHTFTKQTSLPLENTT